jgi:hypothetical protein
MRRHRVAVSDREDKVLRAFLQEVKKIERLARMAVPSPLGFIAIEAAQSVSEETQASYVGCVLCKDMAIDENFRHNEGCGTLIK